jgi:hypothetical protein
MDAPKDFVAEHRLVGRDAKGSAFAVRIALARPEPSLRMSPAWSCTVVVEPIASAPFEIFGEGSLQALCLGAKHAIQTLATFIEQGGRLEYEAGEVFEPSVFGFDLLPRAAPGGDA